MGLKATGSWFTVCHKNKTEDAERVEKGLRPRFFTPPPFENNNIKSGPIFEAHVSRYGTRENEEGNVISRSERTKRRHARGTRATGKAPV